jgi:hypothetical protein
METFSEALLQESIVPEQQMGSPMHPRAHPSLCLTALDGTVELKTCDGKPNQNWFYDRLGTGSLASTARVHNSEPQRVCLTREEDTLSYQPCKTDPMEALLQRWELSCGAIVSRQGVASDENVMVLTMAGSVAHTIEWQNLPEQIWDFADITEHDTCANRKFKVMKFAGSIESGTKLHPFTVMPSGDITVSAWINAKSGTPLSYGQPGEANSFTVSDVKSINLYIHGTKVETGVSVAGVGWVHLTVTWRERDGDVTVYLNGQPRFTKTGVHAQKAFLSGGCFLIGQEGSADCSPSPGRSFDGEIADVQVWSSVMEAKEIQEHMIHPVQADVLSQIGSVDRPGADKSLKLGLLSRQYSEEELGVVSPPVCALDVLRKASEPITGPDGFMTFIGTGGGHYKNFAGCRFNDQGAGEWTAVEVKEEWQETAPLTIQYRTSPKSTSCESCVNGFVSYIDGCAVKYGDDEASISFGGTDDTWVYPANRAMNGESHDGWKDGAANRMSVNFGTGDDAGRHFEARLNDGTYVKCSPRSIIVRMPKRYQGKIRGIAGTGESGQDWEAGPNDHACPKCKEGEQVEGSAGICHAQAPTDAADPFNGNTGTKPVAQFARSWQVDGEIIESVFTYLSNQNPGHFNHNNGEEVKPPLVLKKSEELNSQAAKACQQFASSPEWRAQCIADWILLGDVAVAQTQEDLEHVQMASLSNPSATSVRDISRYRNKVSWTGEASWACADDLGKVVDDVKESRVAAKSAHVREDIPVEGKHIIVYLKQQDARDSGLSSEIEGLLALSEIQVYGEGDVKLTGTLSMSSRKSSKTGASKCIDGDEKTDCQTRSGPVSIITMTLPESQPITKIVLKNSLSKAAATAARNFGAVVLVSDSEAVADATWTSEPIKKQQGTYTFRPVVQFDHSDLTKDADTEFETWDWGRASMQVGNGSMVLPGEETLQTRQWYKPSDFMLFQADLQMAGPGPIQMSFFSKKCRRGRGVGVTLGLKDHEVSLSQQKESQQVPTVADVSTGKTIAVEFTSGMVKLFVDGELGYQEVVDRKIKQSGPICIQSGAGALTVGNVLLKRRSPVGAINQKTAAKAKAKRAKRNAKKVSAAKSQYKAEQKAAQLKERAADAKRQRKMQRAAAREGVQKDAAKAVRESEKKAEAVKCAERKVKDADHAKLRNKNQMLVDQRNALLSKKSDLDLQIQADHAKLAQMKENIVEAKKIITDIDASLDDAKANVTKALNAAMRSVELFKAHAEIASGKSKEKDLADSSTSAHAEYLKQAERLQEMHESRARAVTLLAESKAETVKIEKASIINQEKSAQLASEIKQNAGLIASLGFVEKANEEDKKDNKVKRKPKKRARPRKESFSEMLTRLGKTADSGEAMDLMFKLQDASKQGGRTTSSMQHVREKEALLAAEVTVAKLQSKAQAVEGNTQDPQVAQAQAAVAAAEKTGNPAAVAQAKAQLKALLEMTPEDRAEAKKIEELKVAIQTAKDAGNKPQEQAATFELLAAQKSLDPETLEARIRELELALNKAKKDCDYNPADAKVRDLTAQLQLVKRQAKAEAKSREVNAMIQNSQSEAVPAPAKQAKKD